MKLRPTLILSFSCLLYFGCKTIIYDGSKFKKHETLEYIKSKIDINKIDNEKLKNNDTIIVEIYNSFENLVKKERIQMHLDSFFIKNYSSKKLIHILKMEQYVMKTGGKFILNDSIDPNNAYHVNSIKEFDSLRKILFKRFKKKLKIKTDSINKTKQ